ncbi:MAG: hypothetical protein NT062_26650 [Proteobacteria bacterium]|nr:hypothetical protein [Pseudomonadota bacterium]
MVRSLALVCCFCSLAVAQPSTEEAPKKVASPTTITGDPAKALIRGLKLAGVKPTTTKRTWTYVAKTLSCSYAPDPGGGYVDEGDGFGTTECLVNTTKYTAAAAAVLLQGMHDAGIPEPYYMGKKLIQARAVTCVDEQTTRGAAGPWSCTFTAVGR